MELFIIPFLRRKPPNIPDHYGRLQEVRQPSSYTRTPSYDYIPTLDGLRAIAILLVLIAHFGFEHWVPGGFGVTLFFFISGFLISRQLSCELANTGKIDFNAFYMRRIVRLFPALAVMIVLSTALFICFGGMVKAPEILSALLYMANYYDLYVMYHSNLAGVRHPFSILWSLAIEEHFYILFPFFCAFLYPKANRYNMALLALLATALLWRLYLWDLCTSQECGLRGTDRFYKATDTRFDSILYGVFLTALLAQGRWVLIKNFLASNIAFIAGLSLLLLTFVIRTDVFREILRYTLQGIALMPILTSLLFSSRFEFLRGILASRPMLLIGRWSYSLYLYHWIGLMAGDMAHDHSVIFRLLIATVLTITLSLASYYGIERNALRWRQKFGSHAR
jgi:peptidoglycan/LPS O-acetylase OafA/YrhL